MEDEQTLFRVAGLAQRQKSGIHTSSCGVPGVTDAEKIRRVVQAANAFAG